MVPRSLIPYLLTFSLLACSGGVGPTGGGPAAGGPVGAGPVGAAPVGGGGATGGNEPQFAQAAAAPGADEVVLGPGAADPGELFATLECERKCEANPDGEGSQLSFKAKHGFKPGQRILRVYEILSDDDGQVARYQDVQSDADGNFSFVLKELARRDLAIYLLKATATASPLNTLLPCDDNKCVLDAEGKEMPGFRAACLKDLPEGPVCPMLKLNPNIHL